MRKTITTSLLSLALAAGLALAAAPADAQARGQGAQKQEQRRGAQVETANSRQRPELLRRTPAGPPSVPPGWCIGRGNPHNTPQNCGPTAYDARWDVRRDGRWDRRSFDEAHAAFHREHDARCRALAAQRPTSIEWQVRVQAQCRAEHDAWHRRYDPDWQDR